MAGWNPHVKLSSVLVFNEHARFLVIKFLNGYYISFNYF